MFGAGMMAMVTAIVTGLFVWAKNQSEAALAISKASAELVKQLDHQRESDLEDIAEHVLKIDQQEGVIAAIIGGNVEVNKWIETVTKLLRETGLSGVPPAPMIHISVDTVRHRSDRPS